MRIFFDTEFTALTSDPRLLSIGLVADDGQELYIEFTDGWSEAKCSAWVRQHVLPQLQGGGERHTRRAAGERIVAWLSLFQTPPTLLGETSWDTELFVNLMDECGIDGDGYRLEVIVYRDKAQADVYEKERQNYFYSQHVAPHHALTDARAFRVAWGIALGVNIAKSR